MPVLTLDDGIIKQVNGIFLEGYSQQVRDGQYRLRTSQFRNIADLRFTSPLQNLVWNEEFEGNGSTSDLVNLAGKRLEIAAGGGPNKALIESRGRFHAVPPYSQLVWFAVTIGNPNPLDDIQKRIGLYDDADGIYLQLSGTSLPSFHIINLDIAQDITITRDNWDDPLDGTGESGITIDADLLQLFFLEYSWGGGYARFGVLVNGIPYIAHTEYFGNRPGNSTPMFKQPNLPVRFEVFSATGVAGSMDVFSATVQADAAQKSKGVLRSIDRGAGTNSSVGVRNDVPNVPTYHCVSAIRLKTGIVSGVIRLVRIFLIPINSTILHYTLVFNPTQTLGTTTWVGLNDSSLEYASPGDDDHYTFTQDQVFMSGYAADNIDASIQEIDDNLIMLGQDQVGAQDELYLLVAYTVGRGRVDVFGGMQFREFL